MTPDDFIKKTAYDKLIARGVSTTVAKTAAKDILTGYKQGVFGKKSVSTYIEDCVTAYKPKKKGAA